MARAAIVSRSSIGLALIVVLAAAIRLWLLLGPRAPALDADEAIVGLMANHVVAGTEFPLYYYGQHYLGALEAWCAAAVFAVFGPSVVALRSVPLAFSLLATALVGVLGTRTLSPRAGLFAALLFAVPPDGLAIWSLKARGGFIEVVAIGTTILIAADRLFFAAGGARAAFTLGALFGLGWWVNQQILYYAVPVVALAVWRARDHALVRHWLPALAIGSAAAVALLPLGRPEDFALRLALAAALTAATGLAAWMLRRLGAGTGVFALPPAVLFAAIADDLPGIGGAPLAEAAVVALVLAATTWIAIRRIPERLVGAAALAASLGVAAFSWWNPQAALYALVPLAVVLPRLLARVAGEPLLLSAVAGGLLGGIPFLVWAVERGERLFDVVRAAGGDVASHLAGFASVSLPMLVGARPFWGELDHLPGLSLAVLVLYGACLPAFLRAAGARAALLGGFLAGVPLVFSASAFGWFAREPRYLLPIYSVLFLVPAAAADRALVARRAPLAVAILAGLLALHVGSIAAARGGGGEVQLTEHEHVARSHRELIELLESAGIFEIYTSYWIGYRLAFETGERVVFTSLEQPSTERILDYGRRVRRSERFAAVLPPSRSRLVEHALDGLGIGYRRQVASGYSVLLDLERPQDDPRRRRVELRPEMIAASVSAGEVAAVLDGDLGTRWASHAPQRPDLWIEARFPAPIALGWLEIETGDYPLDHPRGLAVTVESDAGAETVLMDSTRLPGVGYWLQGGRLAIDVGGERVRRVRFAQTGTTEVFDWSVAEIRVWAQEAKP